jgi:hypothetical protein
MPLGESLIPSDSEPNGTDVTLTRKSSGKSYVLSDLMPPLAIRKFAKKKQLQLSLHSVCVVY